MAFQKKPKVEAGPSMPQAVSSYDQVDNCFKKFSKMHPPGYLGYLPSGSLTLDYIFGGGFPIGKIVMFEAAKGVGKSLMSLVICKAVLDADPEAVVLYLDIELGLVESLIKNVMGDDYKEKYGPRFVWISPKSYEESERILIEYMGTGKLRLVIYDSLTALMTDKMLETPKESKDGDEPASPYSGVGMMPKARAEALFCQKMKIFASAGKFGVVYVNQLRANIQMTGNRNAPKDKGAGGYGSGYYNDAMLRIQPVHYIEDNRKNRLGCIARITCPEKNRLVGSRTAYIYLKYGRGISNVATVSSMLKHFGSISQGGAHFTIKDPLLDLGAGLGVEVKALGNAGVDEIISAHFDHIVAAYRESGKLEKFFEEFIQK